jgi:hypothetical protein
MSLRRGGEVERPAARLLSGFTSYPLPFRVFSYTRLRSSRAGRLRRACAGSPSISASAERGQRSSHRTLAAVRAKRRWIAIAAAVGLESPARANLSSICTGLDEPDLSLGGQRARVLRSDRHPLRELAFGADIFRVDSQPPLHLAPAHFHETGVRRGDEFV